MRNIKVIAHRGASALATHENTIDAFKIAIDIHADMVEFDIRETFDKQLVVIHDDNIDGILVNCLTYSSLNNHATKHGYTVPLLTEVLDYCKGKIALDIEIKEPGFEKRVIDMVLARYDYSEFTIKSFYDSIVKRIKTIDPSITTGLLVGKSHNDLAGRFNELFPYRRLKMCEADFVSPNYRLVTSLFVRQMNHLGIPIYVWTVDSKKDIIHYMKKNIQGIISNRPDACIFIRNNM